MRYLRFCISVTMLSLILTSCSSSLHRWQPNKSFFGHKILNVFKSKKSNKYNTVHCDEIAKITHPRVFIVISAPSGAGKTVAINGVLKKESNLHKIASVTTRPIRHGEVHGKDYFFVSKSEFDDMKINGDLIQSHIVFNNHYGISGRRFYDEITSGYDIITDVNWSGARHLRNMNAAHVVTIYILPPSIKLLSSRLFNRGTDSNNVINHRMSLALDEISHYNEYDYVIVAEDIDETINSILNIYKTHVNKVRTCNSIPSFVRRLIKEGKDLNLVKDDNDLNINDNKSPE